MFLIWFVNSFLIQLSYLVKLLQLYNIIKVKNVSWLVD